MASPVIRRIGVALAVVAGLGSLALLSGVFSGDAAMFGSDIVYPIVSIGAGVLLIAGALSKSGAERVSWLLIEGSVSLLGLGELT